MNKWKFTKITMVILPFLAMLLAGGPTSVTIFEPATESATYGSFFLVLDDYPISLLLPLAGISCGLCLSFSVAHLIREKPWMRQAIVISAFAAMSLAVLPLLDRSGIIMLPNMLIPLLLGAETGISYSLMAKEKKAEQAPRLGNKRK